MGVSILSGTLTTLGCGSALFGCDMVTFTKFGVIITFTICISFSSAMFLFGALCHVFGPEGTCGDICFCFSDKKKEINMAKIDITNYETRETV